MGRVGLIGENSNEYIDKLLDIWNHGDCAVLIDWRIPYQTAIEMMREANVSVCYTEDRWLSNSSFDISNNIEFIVFNRKSNSAELVPYEVYNKFCESYSQNEAIVIYSSGTTGRAKGIILSHYAININADAIIDYMRPTKHDCLYIAKTISHSSTITGELLVALKTRTPLVIAPTIVPPRFVFNNINKFKVTIICLNPTLLKMYTDVYREGSYDLFTLKTIYVSGEILNDRLYYESHEVFKDINIYNVYGLSEAGPRVTAQRANGCKSNSVGKPLKNIEIAIVNEQGKLVKNGEYGIVHVNTPSRFNGYITGEKKLESLYKGWLNTGDIGYLGVDNELHIVERIDDVIIIDSHKIYPAEIENTLLENSDIHKCIVEKCEYMGDEFICCFYMGTSLEEKDLKEKVSKVLLPYEIPKRYVRVKDMPKNQNGKVLRNEVTKQLMETRTEEIVKYGQRRN